MKDVAKYGAVLFAAGFLMVAGVRTAEYVLPESPPKRVLVCVERADGSVKCPEPEGSE